MTLANVPDVCAGQYAGASPEGGRLLCGVRAAVRLLVWLALVCLALGCDARGSGPRWVTGPPYFTGQAGLPVIWYTRTPQYFTDPGDLSQYVNHAAADSLVAAAASVWNVPTADFTLAQGGALDEHVSSANSYFSSNGVVFPADVESSNYATKQVAVIYDSDGSVTDLLLGQGASSPVECLQNGVTESVDSISAAGRIEHAVIVLNGRCTGPAPEQQLQMQYQLERVFGRVIGVGWSQTNDNVFTRQPTPTYDQALHWPIMHPIDIVCGPYTYQCLPQPFTLRDDDVASISMLYMIGYSNEFGWTGYDQALPGKGETLWRASHFTGTLSFADGQGMEGVNLVVQRIKEFSTNVEEWQDVSTVSGFLSQQNAWNPVTGTNSSLAGSMGTPYPGSAGFYDFAYIPLINASDGWLDVVISTEPINPLYTGVHAVGPYVAGVVTPSGVAARLTELGVWPGNYEKDFSFALDQSSSSCNAGADGTESAPQPADASGWWTGVLCGRGHTSWASFSVGAGRTATVEITALDENGAPTLSKAMPLIGLWNASDPAGTSPTVALTPSSFNTFAVGTTALTVNGGSPGALRVAITDARGDGRPDFAYKARVLYADAVQPAVTSLNGGLITISGSGFGAGNEVLVNGVAATVATWSPTLITAVAPPVAALGVAPGVAVDVTVKDLRTGGVTTITGALTYTSQAPDGMILVSAPSGTVPVGSPAPAAFAVRVVLPDGVTPAANVPVEFFSAGAAVQFQGCTGNPCTALTDSTGLASTAITPLGFGPVTLGASAVGAVRTASFTGLARSIGARRAVQYVAAGTTVTWTPEVSALENLSPVGGVTVGWTGSGSIAFSPAITTSSASGVAQTQATIQPIGADAQASGEACGWAQPGGAEVCTGLSVVGVSMPQFRLALVSGGGQQIAANSSFAPVVLLVTDLMGHPVAGAQVTFHQVVDQAQMQCSAHGGCPVAAQLMSSTSSAISDSDGMVRVTPLQASGVAEVTNLVAATGTQGFLSLSLTQGPQL